MLDEETVERLRAPIVEREIAAQEAQARREQKSQAAKTLRDTLRLEELRRIPAAPPNSNGSFNACISALGVPLKKRASPRRRQALAALQKVFSKSVRRWRNSGNSIEPRQTLEKSPRGSKSKKPFSTRFSGCEQAGRVRPRTLISSRSMRAWRAWRNSSQSADSSTTTFTNFRFPSSVPHGVCGWTRLTTSTSSGDSSRLAGVTPSVSMRYVPNRKRRWCTRNSEYALRSPPITFVSGNSKSTNTKN